MPAGMESTPTPEGGAVAEPPPGADGRMDPMAGGQPSPSAVPETTKPRQMPSGGGGGMGMDPMGGDTNVPQDGSGSQETSPPSQSNPMAQAARRVMVADILATNPSLGVRQARLLADEALKVMAAAPPVQAPQHQFGNLNDPNNPYSPLHPNHPMNQSYQQRMGPGGRPLQGNPGSQYPYIEDAMNRAVQWGAGQIKQRMQQRKEQQKPAQAPAAPADQRTPTPEGMHVPAVEPSSQGGWVPSVAPSGQQSQTPTPPPLGWKPKPMSAPAQQPAPQPAQQRGPRHAQPGLIQQMRQRLAPPRQASLVYPSKTGV